LGPKEVLVSVPVIASSHSTPAGDRSASTGDADEQCAVIRLPTQASIALQKTPGLYEME